VPFCLHMTEDERSRRQKLVVRHRDLSPRDAEGLPGDTQSSAVVRGAPEHCKRHRKRAVRLRRTGKGGCYGPCVLASCAAYGVRLSSTAPLATCLGAAPAGLAGAASTVQSHKVVLTNASSGTTTVVTKGEEVVVTLSSPGFRWTESSVMSANLAAVLKELSGHVSSTGSSVTTFEVVGYGAASLQAVGSSTCTAGSAGGTCIPISILWQANVDSPVIDPPPPAA
jgi:hypothetical protein